MMKPAPVAKTKIMKRRQVYRHEQATPDPVRKTVLGLAGGVIHIRRTREGATLTVIQDGKNTAIVTLDPTGLTELSEHADDAAEAVETRGR